MRAGRGRSPTRLRSGLVVLLFGLVGMPVFAVDHHLAGDTTVPEALLGSWFRLADGARLDLAAGESLARLPAGVYRLGSGERVFLRHGDGIAGRAASLVGLRTITREELPLREELASHLVALDQYSLVIASWRLADGHDWPWVGPEAGRTGLPQLLDRLNPTAAGFAYDEATGVWVSASGEPIGLLDGAAPPAAGTVAVRVGDLVSAIAADDPGAQYGSLGILVADRGRIGVLDPADEVVCCQGPSGLLLGQVVRQALGRLTGPQAAVHLFRQQPGLEAEIATHGGPAPPIDPDNPIWSLPRWRQGLALAGMAIICLVLLRNVRKWRRRHRS